MCIWEYHLCPVQKTTIWFIALLCYCSHDNLLIVTMTILFFFNDRYLNVWLLVYVWSWVLPLPSGQDEDTGLLHEHLCQHTNLRQLFSSTFPSPFHSLTSGCNSRLYFHLLPILFLSFFLFTLSEGEVPLCSAPNFCFRKFVSWFCFVFLRSTDERQSCVQPPFFCENVFILLSTRISLLFFL